LTGGYNDALGSYHMVRFTSSCRRTLCWGSSISGQPC